MFQVIAPAMFQFIELALAKEGSYLGIYLLFGLDALLLQCRDSDIERQHVWFSLLLRIATDDQMGGLRNLDGKQRSTDNQRGQGKKGTPQKKTSII